MKTLLSIFCAALIMGLTGFASSEENRAQMTLQTSAGPLNYSTKSVALFLDPTTDQITFYFKTQMFRSGTAGTDEQLLKVLQADAFRQIRFDGHLQKSASTLKIGDHLNTAADGMLNLMGVERAAHVPVKITRVSEEGYAFSYSILLDWTSNTTSLAAGKKMQLQGPIRLDLTHTL